MGISDLNGVWTDSAAGDKCKANRLHQIEKWLSAEEFG